MSNNLTVVIRNKNQAGQLDFLLKNLTKRYQQDIDEIIVLDNLSFDTSKNIASNYNVRFETIKEFSYGGSANMAAQLASNDIVVIFSAHAFPVSHDFFSIIKEEFAKNTNLAGVRCLHNSGDFKNYINNISSSENPNTSGLIFCGSAFNKKVWETMKFKDDIVTFEDKEWTVRALKAGYDIKLVPAIFCYDISRNRRQKFARFKNEMIGAYQLWHQDFTFKNAFNRLLMSLYKSTTNFFWELVYIFKRFFAMLTFLKKKPEKF